MLVKERPRTSKMTKMKFDDDPTSYMVWKGTFKSVVADIKTDDFEQLDLLLRWVGPQSSKQVNIRKSNPSSPSSALKKI